MSKMTPARILRVLRREVRSCVVSYREKDGVVRDKEAMEEIAALKAAIEIVKAGGGGGFSSAKPSSAATSQNEGTER